MRKPGLPQLTKHNMEDAPEDTKWVEAIKGTVNGAVQELDRMRSEDRGVRLLDSADVEMVEFDVQVPDIWTDLSLEVPWAGVLKYTKKPDGAVEMRVHITGGQNNDTIGIIPKGYTPFDDIVLPVSDSAGNFAVLGIQADGTVYCVNQTTSELSGVVNYISMDTNPIPLSCWPKYVQTRFSDVVGVVPLRVMDAATTNNLRPGSGGLPDWELVTVSGKRQVKLLNIPNLPYNRKSRVRLLIIGGKNGK